MKISVIVPTYQHASSLPRTVESILNQSLQPTEIIVVDDGSTDETQDVLKPYMDSIQYLYQENAGAPVARNKGFDQSTGDYVIFWDADVVGEPEMLEKLSAALETNPEASWAYARFSWDGKSFGSKPFSIEALRKENYIHTTSLIKREDFSRFDESLKRFQDWDLWLTMAEQGKAGVYVNKECFHIGVEKGRVNISQWMPAIMYKLPWDKIGWAPKRMRKHIAARKVIEQKHKL